MTPDFSPSGLAGLYAGIGRELVTHRHPEGVLNVLTETAVRHVPGAEHAGITQSRSGRFATVAATDDIVHRTDRLQYDLGHGPCVDAIVHNTVFNAADLRTDSRWPEFGSMAFETVGIVSMLSVRLSIEADDGLLVGLNMYSTKAAAFDETAEAIALLLTTQGALAVAAAAARLQADNLTHALRTSREIGVAMGILMHQHKITREQAFDLLRVASQHSNRKVAELAREVADTGQMSLPRQ